ncbi:MAG: ABC transporter permease [Bacteroidetes bacterium]|nr:MAG: ABC transporter permease [Bacteroidota bacterium]
MNLVQFVIEGIGFAIKAIQSNRTRAFLTMLGVATGIFAITSILAMVNSLKTSITENLSALGNTTLFIHNWPWADNHDDWYKYFNRPKVSFREYERLKLQLPPEKIEAIFFQATVANQTARAYGRSISGITVAASTPGVSVVNDFNFSQGRFFSDIEFNMSAPVCIVGHTVAENLFPNEPAVGKYIRIKNKRLRIVGVLEKVGSSLFGMSGEDEMVFIPYALAPRLFNLSRRFVDKLIVVKVANYEDLEYIENEIRGIIRAARGLKPAAEDTFSINKQESVIQQIDQVFGFLEKGGWAISIFSILIGGFSIGLIMYISVRERTNEIGIQKALGATRSFILYQFLVEALLICLLGGALGLMGVYGLTSAIQYLIERADVSMEVAIRSREIFVGLGLSAGVGILSGFAPALIAALIDPVVAIRHS